MHSERTVGLLLKDPSISFDLDATRSYLLGLFLGLNHSYLSLIFRLRGIHVPR